MNIQEKKQYIHKHWKSSSSEKISEMLKRYWKAKFEEELKKSGKNLEDVVDEIFS